MQNLLAQGKLRLERARARYTPVDVAVTTFKRYSDDDGSSYAAALTYYTFLSIFPLLAFALAALGYLTFGNAELRDEIFEAGLNAAPLLRSALTEGRGLEAIAENRQRLALTGLVLALYSGSGAVVALEHALNKINHVNEEPNFVGKRVRSLRWLVILGMAAIASVALTAFARFAGTIFETLGAFGTVVAQSLLHLAGAALGAALFATAFKFLPHKDLSWKEVLPGAILAGVLFEVLKRLGAAYLNAGAQGRSTTFGAFAAAAGLLVASYLICQLTLICAEVNAVLAERRLLRQSQAQTATPQTSQGGSA